MKDKFLKRLSINKKTEATLKSIRYCIDAYSSFIDNKPLKDTTENGPYRHDPLEYMMKYLIKKGVYEPVAIYFRGILVTTNAAI
jgi:hypothetical protein